MWQIDPALSMPSSWHFRCFKRLCWREKARLHPSWGQLIFVRLSSSSTFSFNCFRISKYSESSMQNWNSYSSSSVPTSSYLTTSSTRIREICSYFFNISDNERKTYDLLRFPLAYFSTPMDALALKSINFYKLAQRNFCEPLRNLLKLFIYPFDEFLNILLQQMVVAFASVLKISHLSSHHLQKNFHSRHSYAGKVCVWPIKISRKWHQSSSYT